MVNKALFSSAKHEWETPDDLFDQLNAEFGFTLDAAAHESNAKIEPFYSKEQDALQQPWPGVVWCNPPYGRKIGLFLEKGSREARQRGSTVVFLIPARTDTAWWHDIVMEAAEVRLIRGRLQFIGAAHPAPFPSCVVVFKPGQHNPVFSSMESRP
jgi:site-specific DNA-methyltransferase (adenine-specific)